MCTKAINTFKDWRTRNLQYPPYIAYLTLFVLAVNHGEDGDFSENDYYGRLRDILNEQSSSGMYPSFDKMTVLWDDLEKWTTDDKKEQWGEFYHDIYGKHFYVGSPYYQVVLKKEDRNNLSKIFQRMGWDSDSDPTEFEIIQAFKTNKKFLSKRTSKRTSKRIEKGKDNFLSALVDRTLGELKEYDEEGDTSEDNVPSEKRGFIDLYMEIDNTIKTIDTYFRCRRKADLPGEKFRIRLEDQDTKEWEVLQYNSNISEKMENFNIPWDKDQNLLLTEDSKYKFRYKGEKYKIFTDAKRVSGWTSSQRYNPNKLFYLAVDKSLLDKVKQWGKKECKECQVLEGYSGLPKNWILFKIQGVEKDSIKKDIPALSIDEKSRLKFEGGIRLSRGSKFFSFAPPKIRVTGKKIYNLFYSTDHGEYKILNSDNDDKNSFSLPKDFPVDKRITISDKNSEQKKAEIQINLFLSTEQLKKFPEYSQEFKLNSFGILEQNEFSNKVSFQGAYVCNADSSEEYLKFPDKKFLDYNKKTYLLGELKGQITQWPNQPNSWVPTWMVCKYGRKLTAKYLGDNSKQNKSLGIFTKEEMKAWKDILYHERKRIKPENRYKKQWKKFLEKIENV